MPYETKLIDGGTGVLRIGHGVVTANEIIEAASTLLTILPSPEKVTHGLIDLTGLTSFEATGADAFRLLKVGKNYSGTLKGYVAVAATKPVVYGMSRMFQTLSSQIPGMDFRVFHSVEEAKAWLRTVVTTSL